MQADTKNVLAVTRHKNSLKTAKAFSENELGAKFEAVVMDAAVYPNSMDRSLERLNHAVKNADVILMAAKVYDQDPDLAAPSDLPELLCMMKGMGLGDKPVVVTHLTQFSAEDEAELKKIHPQTEFINYDNIGQMGMKNLEKPLRRGLRIE